MSINEFIQKYYINPIVYDTKYNPVDTITYAVILGLCLFLVLRLLKRLDVKIDERFILAVSPYMFVGSILRVMEDAEIFEAPVRYLFISPLIYFLIFFGCISALIVSLQLYKMGNVKDFIPLFGAIGVVWVIVSLTILIMAKEIELMWVPLVIVGISIAISSIILLIGRHFELDYLTSWVSFSILTAHLIDASSSYIGISRLGYVGKHVLENLLIDYTDSAVVMYPLKLIVLIPTLYILYKYYSDEEDIQLKNIVLLTILMLGIGPGIRNTLRMTLGV
ncbi:MAG: DUF63 family protein [Halobacteriota archaeon]|nr:DUF63 family protein [Halobacteriota archaeon]